jgi:hypothetical protein
MFASGAAVWFAFWLAGLPHYYQQYSFALLLVGTALLVPPSAWIGWGILRRSRLERRKLLSFWLSFYFTVPFAAFDALYCGAYLGHGVGYLGTYWYLTVFYFIPWILYLPMGWWLTRPAQN